MVWDRKVPFDKNGNQEHYPSLYNSSQWIDIYEFDATLRFLRFNRGRSAAYAVFQDVLTQKEFTMFLSNLDSVMYLFKDGLVTGTWTFTKKGKNFGIRFCRI